MTLFLQFREGTEKYIYKWIVENSWYRMFLEEWDVSVLGQSVSHQIMCHPVWSFIKVSILAVFTTGAEVECNNKIYNLCKALCLTLRWYQVSGNFLIPCWITVPDLMCSNLKFHSIPFLFSTRFHISFSSTSLLFVPQIKIKNTYVQGLLEGILCFDVRLYHL